MPKNKIKKGTPLDKLSSEELGLALNHQYGTMMQTQVVINTINQILKDRKVQNKKEEK